MESNPLEHPEDGRILLTDGGSDEEEASSEAEQNETEGDAGNGEEIEEAGESYDDDEGTKVLHLDLQGLFLDVLGLEVDLDEVVLDIDAVPGSGNLLGNLLSGVAGVLDVDLGSLGSIGPLGGGDGEDEEGSVLTGVGDRVSSKAGDLTEDLPLEELVSQLLTELVSQLLEDSSDSAGQAEDGGEDAEAAA